MNDLPFALFGTLRRQGPSFLRLSEPEQPAASAFSISVDRRPWARRKAGFDLLRDQRQSGASQALKQLRQFRAMRRNMPVENGRGDATKVPAEVLKVRSVGHMKIASYANQQLMDNQPLGAKRDELVSR